MLLVVKIHHKKRQLTLSNATSLIYSVCALLGRRRRRRRAPQSILASCKETNYCKENIWDEMRESFWSRLSYSVITRVNLTDASAPIQYMCDNGYDVYMLSVWLGVFSLARVILIIISNTHHPRTPHRTVDGSHFARS